MGFLQRELNMPPVNTSKDLSGPTIKINKETGILRSLTGAENTKKLASANCQLFKNGDNKHIFA